MRSSLDIFTDVQVGSLKFNIPAIWALIFILSGGVYLILNRKISLHPIAKFFLIWLIVLAISSVVGIVNFGQSGLISIRELTRIFTIFFCFILFYNITRSIKDEKIIRYFFLSLIVPLIIGFYQKISGEGLEIFGITRIRGSLVHANSYALYLTLFILLSYWMYFQTRKIFWHVIIFIQLISLVFTVSLSGLILFLLSIIIISFKFPTKHKLVFYTSLILLILIAINTGEFKTRWERIMMIDLSETIKYRYTVDSFTWRIVNWMNLLEIWKEKSFLGFGLDTIQIINPWKTLEGIGYAAHNDYLKILVETGFLGFLTYLLFIVGVGYQLYNEYKVCVNKYNKYLLYILLSFFLSWQFVSFFDNYITVTVFQLYFWASVAIILKLNRIENKLKNT